MGRLPEVIVGSRGDPTTHKTTGAEKSKLERMDQEMNDGIDCPSALDFPTSIYFIAAISL